MFSRLATRHLRSRLLVRGFATETKHIVIALGGNALLQRGQPMTMEHQQANIAQAVQNLRSVITSPSKITLVHGNGPQVGMLALADAEYHKANTPTTLDVLDAETEGMIGYLLEQELDNVLGNDKQTVTLLSQIVVDAHDPAFEKPTKFIGPVYTTEQAQALGVKDVGDGIYWKRGDDEFFKHDGDNLRRVVPSPLPVRLVEEEAVRLLTDRGFIVICAGGGGIPVVEKNGRLVGIEAVIDKDRAATMLGLALGAQGLWVLTDVPGVATNFGKADEQWIKSISPQRLQEMANSFPAGSMGPKVDSAIEFVTKSNEGWCTIGSLKEAAGGGREAGTLVTAEHGEDHIEFYK